MKDWHATYSAIDAEVLQRISKYRGFFELQELKIRHKLFKGGWSRTLSRELFIRNPAVGVLLYDPKLDLLVLLEQFRVGALQEKNGPWQFELVAGIVEEGESSEQVARRESQEEAGCTPSLLIPIFDYLVSPGGTDEKMSLYCGIVNAERMSGVYGLAQEGEDIRLQKLSLADAVKGINDGLINNAATMLAIQWLELHKSDVLEQCSQTTL